MAEIYNELVAVYGSKAPSISTVKKWVAAFKLGKSVGKVMASIFCDSKGVIMINFLEKRPNNQWAVLLKSGEETPRRNQVQKTDDAVTRSDLPP